MVGRRPSLAPLLLLLVVLLVCSLAAGQGEADCDEASGVCKQNRELAYNYYLAGNEQYSQGELALAVKQYEEALRFDPLHSDTLCNLGSALQDMEDFQGSFEAYQRAVDANPYHATAHFNLGLLLHNEEVYFAIEHYQAALESDPAMADAWSNLGTALHGEGIYDEAVTCYQEAIELYEQDDPDLEHFGPYLSSLFLSLGQALSTLEDEECIGSTCSQQAIEALQKAVQLDPDNAAGQHNLSVLLEGVDGQEVSKEYISRLFDDYSATFDAGQTGLPYRAPELLHFAVQEAHGSDSKFGEVFDAGCGTGFSGPLLRDLAETLVGVDDIDKMVQLAKEREVYDELLTGDIAEQLDARRVAGHKGGLVVAAEVLVFKGDLGSFFSAAAQYLEEGGLLVFTVEQLEVYLDLLKEEEEEEEEEEEKDWLLLTSGRYAHTAEYVEREALKHGLEGVIQSEIMPRLEGGRPVFAHLFAMRRRIGDEEKGGGAEEGAEEEL